MIMPTDSTLIKTHPSVFPDSFPHFEWVRQSGEIPYHEDMRTLSDEEVRCFRAHSNGNHIPFHWHEAIEILWLRSGDLTIHMQAPDETLQLATGQWAVLPSGVIHETRCVQANDALVLQIPDSFLRRHALPGNPYRFVNPIHPEDGAAVSAILREIDALKEHQPHHEWRFQSLLFELLYHLHCEHAVITPKQPASPASDQILRQVLDYTMQHCDSPLTIAEIAGVAGFQPKYFCRFFKRHLSQTYHEYLSQLRFSRITRDMLSSDISLGQLLERHGFSNYRLFLRMFRETYGMTPKGYRMRMINVNRKIFM